MEDYNYDALAINTEIEDIPYISENNKGILRRLKDNDAAFNKFWICGDDAVGLEYDSEDDIEYHPGNNIKELGWLGYYLWRNTTLQELYFLSRTIHDADFYIGLNRNKSIKKIVFLCIHDIDFWDGQMFHMVAPFLKNNHSLTDFQVYDCELGAEGIRLLSLALGGATTK